MQRAMEQNVLSPYNLQDTIKWRSVEGQEENQSIYTLFLEVVPLDGWRYIVSVIIIICTYQANREVDSGF